MKKIKFCCGTGGYLEDIFEFDDDWTKDEISTELWNWAEQFLEAWTEEVDDE